MNRLRFTTLLACLLGSTPLYAADGQVDVLLKLAGTVTINNPGSYVVVSSVAKTDTADGISISASDVTLDMNGQSLRGLGGSGIGIRVSPTASRVRIKNGSVSGFGGGGILLEQGGPGGLGHVISNMQVTENGAYNLEIRSGQTTVEGLAAMSASGDAIHIAGSDVTLDLGGQSVRGSGSGTGIVLAGTPNPSRVRIRNGSVSGFAIGVDMLGSGHVVTNLKVSESTSVNINVQSKETSIESVGVNASTGGAVDGIRIGADDVTLDLNGQALRASAGAGVGIKVQGTASRARISNGSVSGFGGDGIFLGPGTGHHVTNMSVIDSGPIGIDVQSSQTTVRDCRATGASNANLQLTGDRSSSIRNNLLGNPGTGVSLAVLGSAGFTRYFFVRETLMGHQTTAGTSSVTCNNNGGNVIYSSYGNSTSDQTSYACTLVQGNFDFATQSLRGW
jgi:hypothetical protein